MSVHPPTPQPNASGLSRWTTVAEREFPEALYPNRGFTVWESDDHIPTTPPATAHTVVSEVKHAYVDRAVGDLFIKVEHSSGPPQIIVYPVCAPVPFRPLFPSGIVHVISTHIAIVRSEGANLTSGYLLCR